MFSKCWGIQFSIARASILNVLEVLEYLKSINVHHLVNTLAKLHCSATTETLGCKIIALFASKLYGIFARLLPCVQERNVPSNAGTMQSQVVEAEVYRSSMQVQIAPLDKCRDIGARKCPAEVYRTSIQRPVPLIIPNQCRDIREKEAKSLSSSSDPASPKQP